MIGPTKIAVLQLIATIATVPRSAYLRAAIADSGSLSNVICDFDRSAIDGQNRNQF